MTKDFERLVWRRERNPMLINGETGGENGQVEIDPGQSGQP